jgi:hypothetical protein
VSDSDADELAAELFGVHERAGQPAGVTGAARAWESLRQPERRQWLAVARHVETRSADGRASA